MRKNIAGCCLFILIQLSCFGQTLNQTAKLKYFIKVWGFLKYYHPIIATGNIDWDSVFITYTRHVINFKTSIQYNNELLAIINSLGVPPKIQSPKIYDSLFEKNKTDLSWAYKSKEFGGELKKQLKLIYDNRSQDTNRYIKIPYETPDFSGEKRYENIGFPNFEFRLLFLSRFWNIINYYAPYKYLTTNWDDVLEKFIPKVINSNDTLSYYKALQELCKSLNDGHSQLRKDGHEFSDLYFGSYTPPLYCEIIYGQVIIRSVNDSISKSLNIKRGDIVLKINDEELINVIKHKKIYISSSNETDENHQLSRFILDGETPKVILELKRGNKIIHTTITRVLTQPRNWKEFFNYTANNVGYEIIKDSILLVYAMQIWDGNIDTIKHLIQRSKAIIFDVRNHPNNDAFFSIVDPFLSEPKTIDYSTIALPEFPGFFKWRFNPNKLGHFTQNAFTGKVIILCDERTQSQGEYSCMVLQSIPGSITIGSKTAGADGKVTYIPMGNGLSLSYSGYGIYYPDKTQTQRVGIKIDIPVKKTLEAVKTGKDEILERATQYIINNK